MRRTPLSGLVPTRSWNRPSPALLVLAATLSLAGVAAAQSVPPPDAQLSGETGDDGFGWAVESAGDVNDDGFMDYIVSAPGDDDVAEGSGKVYVFYGPLTRDVQAGRADASITGEEIVDDFGSDVASAGDVNGDGVDDIVIGARSTDTSGIQAGRAYVFFGPVAGRHAALDADAIISGDEFDELGWSVAPAGDVNGDGIDDILVGAWMADLRGQAHLFLGPVQGQLTVADAAATVTGVIASEELGYDIAAGDLNDDGVPDLILGAPRPPLFGNGTGRAYVFFGPVSGSHAATEADAIVTGDKLNDELGTSVAAGDLNDDGADDLVVGAHQLFVQNARGKAYVFYGPLRGVISAGTADAILTGEDFPVENGLFGESVAVLGDSDGDGVGDLLVGAPFAEAGAVRTGRAYVFNGPLFGRILANGADRIITGSEFDLLGSVVAAAGDNDGDGLMDALVGAPQFFGENGIGFAGLYAGEGVAPSGLELTVTPVDPPVVIPAAGGTVRLRIAVVNNAAVPRDFDLWTVLERPDGRTSTSSPLNLTVDAGATLTRALQRRIPASAPAGSYTLRGLVGAFPTAEDVDAFTFVKE